MQGKIFQVNLHNAAPEILYSKFTAPCRSAPFGADLKLIRKFPNPIFESLMSSESL